MRTTGFLPALVVAAGLVAAAWVNGRYQRYTLLGMGLPKHAFRLDAKTGQVCHVMVGADEYDLFVVGCTTRVTEQDQ
jgi:hypothetical protein